MMSGTSVDGIDVAAIEMGDDGATVLPDAAHFAYTPELRARVLRAAAGASVGTHELAALHAALGDAYADAASDFVERLGRRPDLIALHGQTVAHLPRKATLQLGDASRVAVRTGVTTIADFRSADIAAGAAGGRPDPDALAWGLGHPYFARRAPKSTGREDFGQPFADELNDRVARSGGSHDDALATAVALTVRTVADALRRETPKGVGWRELAVGGGGARNATLLAKLREEVSPTAVITTDELGVPSSSREAISFAILGIYRLRGLPNTLPSATGAKRAVSGGAIHQP